MQKPFQLNIPRHNTIVQKDGSGFKLKFQMLAIPTYRQNSCREILGLCEQGPFVTEIMKKSRKEQRYRCFSLRRQECLQQRNVTYVYFQVGLSRGKT